MYIFFNRHSAATFCNVRRYRNRSPAQLVTKRVLLCFWKLLQQLIDLHYKFSGLFPSVKFLELELKIVHFCHIFGAKVQKIDFINAALLQIFTPYPLPLPHEKYSYFDFAQHAARRRSRRPQALDQIGRDPRMAKLHSATLQFLQGNATVQAAQLRANSPSTNLLHLLCQ